MSEMIPHCGNRLIDAYHHRLSELLTQAAALIREDRAHPDFAGCMAAFRDVLAEHFESEAVILRGSGYGDAQAHMARHDDILAQVDARLGDASLHDDGPHRHSLVQELERLLYEHELLEDIQYWDDVRSDSALGDLQFDDALRIGVDWIDLQHRDLVHLVNDVRHAAKSGDGKAIVALMDRFLRHARQHFADEERHLEAMGLSSTQHSHGHRHLLAALERVADRVAADPSVVAGDYLKFWLIDHLQGDDRRDFSAA